jgi:2-oxoglutarate dehydrogenase E2 component (dihydrolipoamide succinyltransferase)
VATEVIMPQMGESIAEGTITRWMVKPGERVERDQPLLEISTDKVDAEVPSPATGILLEVLFQEGDTVEVDEVIALIGAPEERTGEGASQAPVGAGAASAAELDSPPSPPAAVAHTEVGESEAVESGADTPEGSALSFDERVRVFSSPVVRKIAKEENVDLAQVRGTGVSGRVTKRDILAYLESGGARTSAGPAGAASPPAAATRPAPPPVERAARDESGFSAVEGGAVARPATLQPEGFEFSVPAYAAGDSVRIEPMSRIRKITAAHMLYSQQTSAHVATVFDVDLSNVVATRERAKHGFAQKEGTKLTYMPFFFKALAEALVEFPKFNASLDGTDIVFKQDVNLGMAVATDSGLLVPVIKNAHHLNLAGLARAANDLADRSRSKKLKPEDLQGGTFTVTNPGVFGSLFGTPLINQPQVAILCLGAIEKRVVVVTDEFGNDSLSIRPMAYLCLSYDHRLIDGADAEQFMVEVKRILVEESWSELLPYGG